jgi:MoaA/NifB/PqqE/SkfB family radical SAM enzyme
MHKKECSTHEAVSLVHQLAETGCKRLHLTGGEPALRADIGDIVTAAKESGMMVTIATSGWNIQKLWSALQDIDIFFLSFDGPREIHDAQRGAGSFDVVTDAMNFLAKQHKKFWTTTVLTSLNLKSLDYILHTAQERQFKTNFHILYTSGADAAGAFHVSKLDDDMKVQGSEYREALEFLLVMKKNDMRRVIGSSGRYLNILRHWGDLSETYRASSIRDYTCWAGKLYCYLDAAGDLYACGDVMGRTKPVNALEHGFAKAFTLLPLLPCKSCTVACFTELNLMFSLRLAAILNWLKNL